MNDYALSTIIEILRGIRNELKELNKILKESDKKEEK
jgi:hypothetical protein